MNLVDRPIKVFVSYTMRDCYVTTHFLECLESSICSYSSVYIDILHNNSELKQMRVENELISSNLIILLESESVHESTWVKRELNLANSNAIPIIQVQVRERPSIESIIDKVKNEILSYKKELTKAINTDIFPQRFCCAKKD